MKKDKVEAEYRMPLAGLVGLGKKGKRILTRDLSVLGPEANLTQAVIDDIETRTTDVENFETDEEMLVIVNQKTYQKDKKRLELTTKISDGMSKAAIAFGIRDVRYKRFGTGKMHSASDWEMVNIAKRCVRMFTYFLQQLSSKGMTEQKINDISTNINSYMLAIDAKEGADETRDIITDERITKANELYKILVSWFEAGKSYWYTRNESKYNDYVIYLEPLETQIPVPPVPPVK